MNGKRTEVREPFINDAFTDKKGRKPFGYLIFCAPTALVDYE